MKKYLKNKGRYILLALIIVLLKSNCSIVDAKTQTETTTYEVKSGDTLWNIAEEYSEGQDLRDIIDSMMEYNNLSTTVIHPGQILKVEIKR